METFRILTRFWRGLCTNWIGTAGVMLTTSSFALFICAELMRMTGALTNAYLGLISYLALPALFVLGLFLIPFGWWLYRRRIGKPTRELLSERFDASLLAPKLRGSRFAQTIALLTLINVLFLGVGSARMLSFMEKSEFCGTACHSVMGPEWAAYQDSPHARVHCVECHVGPGAGAAFDAKLNGMWQMVSVTFNLYKRPIPTPVHNLRPARQTCEHCHWPEAFYGNRIKRIIRYDHDQDSTPTYTTLALKVGSGKGETPNEIHWHIANQNEVRYQPADETRLTMRWVEVRRPDGSFHRFVNRDLPAEEGAPASSAPLGKPAAAKPPAVRTMDCVDCHNRATHIYEDPDKAVDLRIQNGKISRSLPFAKRQAVAALTGHFTPGESALPWVERKFVGYYRRNFPQVLSKQAAELKQAVATLKQVYRRNIHAAMQVTWNAYPDHLGHQNGPGCMRCHSANMVDAAGQPVKSECTLCHSLLAYESHTPFHLLMTPDPQDPECRMQVYAREEFLGVTRAPGDPDPCKRTPTPAPPQ